MDGVEGRQGVIVIGCTNQPDQIDDAILRPGTLPENRENIVLIFFPRSPGSTYIHGTAR